MSNTCFACHGPDEETNESELRLDSFQMATESAIVPGDAEGSLVYERLIDQDDPMPPADFRHHLTDYDKALFKRWIEQGAEYQKHWSYTDLKCPPVPELSGDAADVTNPVDRFVLARLERDEIDPSPMADKATLLRRLSLDLTGLPPTLEELDDFLADESDEAYERQVDRLLASTSYGERMAVPWLDIVRFSDTVGYHGDQNQRIFPYRDYVIDSINQNKPFDQFTREQLAGDLLEAPTQEQLVATGLIRLNMMTREGGAQPEEYLAKYTADRVRMLGTAWLGSTTGCCECHNHKYDPFTIRDFYSLGAFFDDVRQWGVYTTYRYTPNPDLTGFSNAHPFPPELRVKSPSLLSLIGRLETESDNAAAEAVKSRDDAQTEKSFQVWLQSTRRWLDAHRSGWQTLPPKLVTSKQGTPIEIRDEAILLKGEARSDDTLSLPFTATTDLAIRTVQLEVLPDSANEGRIGRGKDGRFSASLSLQVDRASDGGDNPITIRPRYVRIELDADRPLSLAEVEVFSESEKEDELVNVASQGQATQSTTDYEGVAERAIDGVTNGDYRDANSVTHTKHGEKSAWWELDLKSPRPVSRIVVWNRTDHDYAKRIKDYKLVLLDENRHPILERSPSYPDPSASITMPQTQAELRGTKTVDIDFAQADRKSPSRYTSGKDPSTLSGMWRSGPTVWQLPENETTLPHTALYHLKQTLHLSAGDKLVVSIKSGDIGKFRVSVSPITRYVAGDEIATAALSEAFNTQKDVKISDAPAVLLAAFYRATTSNQGKSEEIRRLKDSILDCYSGYAMTMVAQSLPTDQIPQARVLPRGNWQDNSGDLVTPRIPEFLGSAEPAANRLSRIDLANWLTSEQNPLVARHYVNRTWKLFFGSGLSNKLDDLGNQGEWPSHPGLLDWLACQFREDWDMKKITRLIVTSRTYRQQAAVRSELRDSDPYNRLLAQQSARRLGAEAIRDSALAIAGLLQTDYTGGPSVFPYQPDGHYSNLQFPGRTYVQSADARQHRRGVYMHWQRTFLHPMLVNFDAPSRDECVADRTLSNSPQQALTLLNDPSFVEAARAFATRLANELPDASFEAKLERAFQLALARPVTGQETAGLAAFYEKQLDHYLNNPDDLSAFESDTDSNDKAAVAEHAAWSQVCRVILNLHETITRF
ncbi:MAG: DUF1553 domain-containing protein [Rubripirellula sp.]